MCLGAVAAGTALAWTSPVLPQITPEKNSTLNGTANAIAAILTTPASLTDLIDLRSATTPATTTNLANITAALAASPIVPVVPVKKDIILDKDQGTLISCLMSLYSCLYNQKLLNSFLNFSTLSEV